MKPQFLKGKNLLILISFLAFISLGLPDGLLGINWPFLSARSKIDIDSLGIVLLSFVAGYLTTSISSGKIISKFSLGIVLTLSCVVTGSSLLAYAILDTWLAIIFASYFLGAGGGAIDASINVFAATRFTPSIVNWLHGFYGIGATTGPFIMTFLFANNQPWYHGYILVGIVQITLSLIFLMTINQWKVNTEKSEPTPSGSYRGALRIPFVWVLLLIFFLYTGLEIGFGQWIFTILTKSRNIREETAGLWTSAYWGSFTGGRIIFGFILTKTSVKKVISFATVGVLLGTILFALNHSEYLNLIGIILLGLSNAPIFPSFISITPKLIGERNATNVIGFQISAAMIGGAVLPGLAGFLTDSFGLEFIPLTFVIEASLLSIIFFFSKRRQN